MRSLLLASLALLLAACLPIPGLFYIGQLDSHDRSIFREAARIEGVETMDWPAPGAWVVAYGSPTHDNEITAPGVMFIRKSPQWTGVCTRDQMFLSTSRHGIGHTKGKPDKQGTDSVMNDPTPCEPTD